MAIRSISQLKAWFSKGKFPTEEQFAGLIDSFVHKQEDKIPISQVENLCSQLNGKFASTDGAEIVRRQQVLETTFADHKSTSKQQFQNIDGNIQELEAKDEKIDAELREVSNRLTAAEKGIVAINNDEVNRELAIEFNIFDKVAQNQIQWVTAASSTSEGASVCFNNADRRSERRFLLHVGGVYYAHWADSDRFGIAHSNGVEPYPHKIYFREVEIYDGEEDSHYERAYHRWDGHNLTPNLPTTPAIVNYAYIVETTIQNSDGTASPNPAYHRVTLQPGSYMRLSAADPGSTVVYAGDLNRFMLCYPSATPGVNNLFPLFTGQEEYGTPDGTTGGIIPYGFKLYRNTTSGEYQQWNGTKLTAPLSAYDVNAQLMQSVATLTSAINGLRTTIDSLTARIETLEGAISGVETDLYVLDARHNTLESSVTDPETGLAKTTERVAALETRFADGVLLL